MDIYQYCHYEDIRHDIKPGDIIAFGGNSLFSRWTKFTTNSDVTHVAIVAKCMNDPVDGPDICIIEATDYKGIFGVMTNCLCTRVKDYDGDLWWLPLNQELRQTFLANRRQLYNFVQQQLHKPYDIWQLFGSAVDWFDEIPILNKLTLNQEDESRWFCSELIAKLLQISGVIQHINPAETTPIDICRFSIFAGCNQIKGETRHISKFNSCCADGWGFPKGA